MAVRHPVSGRFTGEIAAGHPVSPTTPSGDPNDPGRVDQHVWLQPATRATGGLVPSGETTLTMTAADAQGHHGSSLASHCGPTQVRVTQYDLAAAAQPDIAQVFAPNMPSGRPGQPAPAIARTGGNPVVPRPPGVAWLPSPADSA